MKRLLVLFLILTVAACSCAQSENAIQTAIAETQTAQPSTARKTEPPTPLPTHTPATTNTPKPTDTPELSPTPSSLLDTDTPPAQPPLPILYYYFVETEGESPPAGSVVILSDVLILGPTLSDIARSPDTATNIGSGLQVMLNDPRNAWTSTDVGITSITFRKGTTNVVLDGEYFGAGDVVLIAARAQILLTVFAEASVQAATITLNGKNIANLGISHSSEAKPADYTYTRAEIEIFMAENAYENPLANQEGQKYLQTLNLRGIWQQNGSMAAGWADRYHFYPSGTFHYYPNEMTCSTEKIEKIGTWKYENTILTLTTTKQIIKSLEIYPSGLCHVIGKKEVKLAEPSIEQISIVDHGVQEGDIYPSISINDLQFWKFSDDASSYGSEIFPE